MHGVMIAIEHSYKLDRKNYFNLWCELGWLLLREFHMRNFQTILSDQLVSLTFMPEHLYIAIW